MVQCISLIVPFLSTKQQSIDNLIADSNQKLDTKISIKRGLNLTTYNRANTRKKKKCQYTAINFNDPKIISKKKNL